MIINNVKLVIINDFGINYYNSVLILIENDTFFRKNYGSRSKKGEFLHFELSHNALNRKPQK